MLIFVNLVAAEVSLPYASIDSQSGLIGCRALPTKDVALTHRSQLILPSAMPSQVSPTSSCYEQYTLSTRSNDHVSVEASASFAGKAALAKRNPCILSWKGLSYSVSTKKKTPKCPDGKKDILFEVTGRCAPGELTAIMGPSGSGKTTLLDILADRICSGTIKGDILLNGESRNTKMFRAVSSYVAQEDSLLGSFTVLETLEMAARLTMPSGIPSLTTAKRVQRVIDDMGLRVCENTMVGIFSTRGSPAARNADSALGLRCCRTRR